MRRKKEETEVSDILVNALTPEIEETTKRQMHSLVTLAISIMLFVAPFTTAAAAGESVSYQVSKNATAVNGIPGGNVTSAGDIISYQINVNNTAEVDLTNVTVNDPMIGIVNNVTNLTTGSNETFYGNYTVTQADMNSNGSGTGFIINNVTVVCDQNSTVNSANASVPIEQHANCTIEKTVLDVDGYGPGGVVTKAGNEIIFQVNVTNNGNVDLYNVTVTDPLIGTLTGPTSSLNDDNVLNVGETWTYTGNYMVSQADITNNGTFGDGYITNNASVVGNYTVTTGGTDNSTVPLDVVFAIDCSGSMSSNDPSNLRVSAAQNFIDNLDSSRDAAGFDAWTDQVISSHALTADFSTLKSEIGALTPGGSTDLDAGLAGAINILDANTRIENSEKVIIFLTDGGGPYTTTTAQTAAAKGYKIYSIALGSGASTAPLEDMANVTGGKFYSSPDAESLQAIFDGLFEEVGSGNVTYEQIGPINATATVPIKHPNYSIFKSVIDPDARGDCIINTPGDKVPYRIVVKNEGDMDLTNVTVNDSLISLPDLTGDENDPGVLNPGETWVYDGIYTLTQGDIDNGNIYNNATVICDQLPEKSCSVNTPVDQHPTLSIYKSVTGIDLDGDDIINNPGDIINYQVAVKNNGDVKLTGISVDDPMVTLTKSSGDLTDKGVLDPGETWIYSGDYAVTQSDIDTNGGGTGFITNTATVHCNELSDESSTLELPIVIPIQTSTNDGDNTSVKVSPEASFSTSVSSGYAPLTVQFTDTSTGTPTSWTWDFGDGGNSAQQSPVYTYNTPGTFSVKLTVSNANGSGSTTKTITVQQTTGSSGGGSGRSSGGSIGSASVVGSSSTDSTGTANVTQPATNTSNIEPSTTPVNVEPTPVQTATSTPAKQSNKTPGFEIIFGATALFGAAYLYRKR